MMLRHLPNLISASRLLMALPIAWLIMRHQLGVAAVLFIVMAATDAIDGALARAYDWHSYLGSILDPMADKLLMLSTAAALWQIELLPGWFLIVVLARDLLIVAGAYVYDTWIAPLQPEPSILSKLTTAIHATMLVGFMLQGQLEINDRVCQLLLAGTTTLLVASGVHYVARYTRRAIAHSRAQEPPHD